ncbi:hypothetical protein AMTRI_Chr06g174590 [Amborella trichopoda]|uniref:non-specific serine/threonine protein kinase n=1 Tax=Amborella trichopoda TaxID=13333 RepID=W1PIE9_AMBTC|nr:receptor protein kinase-like protein ZAR1 [Amborella trichopoda]ERN06885.1 hypothetical protein AMTR_s00005p00251950 [Amborella trichopoda]|eukprot:XP_006845210.1 receptor protein kinase-like protein ZAR1 [Amborella trichopoda]
MGLSFFVCSLLSLLLLIPFSCSLTPDGLSLLALKSAVDSDPNQAFSDWNENDTTPCHWSGVSCMAILGNSDPRVVGITISNKGLHGYIPSELGALVYLRRLNLHGNHFAGSLPSQLFNASSLHSLILYDNNFTGSLPPGLCRPPRLQNLDLSHNDLGGPLSPNISQCKQLQRLILAGNRFSGEIPAGLGSSLKNLVQLDLSSNLFNGSLPPDLGDLGSLSGTMNLSENQFSGEIPASLGRLPITVSLDLRSNNLSGQIPQQGSLTNQGPTAFLDNPGLCGFPLQNPCRNSPISGQRIPAITPEASKHIQKGMKPGIIVAISAADALGVAMIGGLIVFIYWRARDNKGSCSCTGKEKLGRNHVARKWFCGKNRGNATESGSEKGGEGELVAIDKGFHVEMEELLRASAYVLGKSSLGIVYKVVVGNGIPVAVRRLGEGGAQRFKEFEAEVEAIGKVRHPNVVRLRAYYWAPDEKLLICDYISNGNLITALHGRSGQAPANLPWPVRLKIAKGTARGLAHLHDCSPRKYVHGDIKPSNILLDSNLNPYISDFGLSRLFGITGNPNANISGGYLGSVLPYARTPSVSAKGGDWSGTTAGTSKSFTDCYKAPEARIVGARPAQKWDVYSFGVVLLEMLTGRSPEAQWAATGEELVSWVRKAFEEEMALSEIVDPALLREVHAKKEVLAAFHVALTCTEAEPEARPRMKSVSDALEKIGSSSYSC